MILVFRTVDQNNCWQLRSTTYCCWWFPFILSKYNETDSSIGYSSFVFTELGTCLGGQNIYISFGTEMAPALGNIILCTSRSCAKSLSLTSAATLWSFRQTRSQEIRIAAIATIKKQRQIKYETC